MPETLIRELEDEAATAALGRELSLFVRLGDVICLRGDLGSGKTALARALIAALSSDSGPEVPSPTFTLVQLYDETRLPVAHFDFYRLTDPTEAVETGFHELAADRLTLVEWPDRIEAELPGDRLEVRLVYESTGRRAELKGHGEWRQRLARLAGAAEFLMRAGWGGAHRRYLIGDASTRRYERLRERDRRAVLMDMPARPDGPPVRHGKSYSALAHLAEDCRAVVAINTGLRQAGFSAPEIFAHDMAQGFLLIEDFGDQVFGRLMTGKEDVSEMLLAATVALAEIAEREWPEEVALPDGQVYRLQHYDNGAYEIEVSLLLDWYWPMLKGAPVPASVREEYEAAWRSVFPIACYPKPLWVLRDYHSPNLIWLPDREGTKRVGMIDTQDCVLGHPAYDLAALLQDARVDIPQQAARDLFDFYCALRQAHTPEFDPAAFEAAYAFCGAERASKILGIFTRLSKRDGKHHYLHHLPRASRILERNLVHPYLKPVRGWFENYLPFEARQAAPRRAA